MPGGAAIFRKCRRKKNCLASSCPRAGTARTTAAAAERTWARQPFPQRPPHGHALTHPFDTDLALARITPAGAYRTLAIFFLVVAP